ncbi:hypothetical protein Xen7305DRAFT_00011820 [Xenococcus sp. PCC 7305]|nr:hypothetical protein Xen7305DRAFT_00011820 [Xenococcus sp. PCC 7305]
MKFLLLRVLLLSRRKDRGFTLPMVIGIGLIMVLLSSISLVQSSEENLIAISKVQSSTSVAMAELGIARYRELLNNNRVLAVNSLNNWVNVNDETCNVITDAANDDDGWANTDDWRPVTIDETALIPPTDLNNDGNITNNLAIGSYRIVDYRFQNDNDPSDDDKRDDDGNYEDLGEDGIFDQTSDAANPFGPRGILAVQGQDINGSVAQIQVTIPIGVNTEDLDSLDPGIWIHQSAEPNLGTINRVDNSLVINDLGNLVFYRTTTGDNMCTDVAGPEDAREPRDLPPLAVLPAVVNNIAADITGDGAFDIVDNELILGQPSGASAANPNLDADGIERYYYQIPVGGNLNVTAGESLLSDGNARVVIVVNGNLDIDGAAGNVHVGNTSDKIFIGNINDGNLVANPFYAKSNYLEIHVNGDVNLSGDGDLYINGLIRATGTVNITGSPNINLRGSIWAEDWDNGGGTVNLIREADYDDYKFYSIVPQRTPRPLTFAPTGWEQQQVTN